MSPETIHISSFEQLAEVMLNLHDCPFDLDRVDYHASSGTWRGSFLRPVWDDPRAEHRGLWIFYVRSRIPLIEAILTISDVVNQTVIDDQGIDRYSFNEVERLPAGVQLRFNEALRIDLSLAAEVTASYVERPLTGSWAIYRQYFLLQSGPTIETLTEQP